MKRSFEEDLAQAIEFHGHLCAGQVLGTRVTRIGLSYFGIDEPEKYRDLIAIVEADRCLADAVATVCRCSLGRRRLKWHDLGKMAATFYDIATDKAIRVYVSGMAHAPKDADVVEFYNQFSDEEFFTVQEVTVDLTEFDLPGRPKRKVLCEQCGEQVQDGRDVQVEGRTLCKTCAGIDVYYHVIGE
ncbi:MAG: formylmethanofuran dehydrogenase [Actinobacteria bacterium]|nr:formylmethanofuran dehydrogenase [Actinomycetota bacterium]